MKKMVGILLVGTFALSFVFGAIASKSEATVPLCLKVECVERLGEYYWYVCCPDPDFKGSRNSPKWGYCYVDYSLPCGPF